MNMKLLQRLLIDETKLSLLNTVDAPSFDENNITTFLKAYNYMTKNEFVSKETKWRRFLRYMRMNKKDEIWKMKKYCDENFDQYEKVKFYAALKLKYKKFNWDVIKNNKSYLLTIVKQEKLENITLDTYINTFYKISSTLIDNEEMT